MLPSGVTVKALVPASSQSVAAFTEMARRYAAEARADSTLRCYASAWREFEQFARGGELPASPQTVIAYITALADSGAAVSTIGVKLAAVSFRHTLAKLVDPAGDQDVQLVMAGIRRMLGTHQAKKSPILLGDLRAMVAALDTRRLQGKRDKALLLLGWAGAFRRSELVALDVADLAFSAGMRVTIRRSKTDQEGEGMVKFIPLINDRQLDPTLALKAWIDAAGIVSGPVFRRVSRWGRVGPDRLTSRSVGDIVKLAVRRVGLDHHLFSGHSLRIGFVTACALAGQESRNIMAQTGHKSEVIMRGYIQDAGQGASAAVRAAFGCVR